MNFKETDDVRWYIATHEQANDSSETVSLRVPLPTRGWSMSVAAGHGINSEPSQYARTLLAYSHVEIAVLNSEGDLMDVCDDCLYKIGLGTLSQFGTESDQVFIAPLDYVLVQIAGLQGIRIG
jgi:hypothetical protein